MLLAAFPLSTQNRRLLTESSHVPQAVVDGADTSTMLRMADLSEQDWGGELSQTVAETEDETSSSEESITIGEGSHDGTRNHEDTSDGDGYTTSKSIGKRRATSH